MNLSSADIRAMPESPMRTAMMKQLGHADKPQRLPRGEGAIGQQKQRLANGGMNKLERDYANRLEQLRIVGEIKWWKYEGIKLRLANGIFYKPDFAVLFSDGRFEFFETKGFFREAARVRINVASELYPWKFVVVRKVGGEWTHEEIK